MPDLIPSPMPSPIEAEFAVRQLHARYGDAVWRQDAEGFAALFAEDAVWRIAGTELVGRAAIRTGFVQFMAILERTLMTFRTPIVAIAVDGEVSARTYVTEQNKYRDGTAVSTIGVYYERFVWEDGQGGRALRFAWRHWQMYYYGPADLSEAIHAAAEFGPPPGLPGPGEPTTERAKVWGVAAAPISRA